MSTYCYKCGSSSKALSETVFYQPTYFVPSDVGFFKKIKIQNSIDRYVKKASEEFGRLTMIQNWHVVKSIMQNDFSCLQDINAGIITLCADCFVVFKSEWGPIENELTSEMRNISKEI